MSAIDAAKEHTARWLEAVPGAAAAGASATFDPRYEAVRAEAAKLDAPTAQTVDWAAILDKGGDLLATTSKDLVIAAYMAHALHQTKGLSGLLDGIVLVTELVDRYWEGLFPELKRMRGRVNAITWLVERSVLPLDTYQVGAADREPVMALDAAVARFAEVIRARFAENAPAVGPLRERMERFKLSLPPEAPPPPPPPPPPDPNAPPPPPAPVAAPAPAAAVADLADAAQGVQFLRDTGAALMKAANTLRAADVSDPLGYRILRVGLWLHMQEPPPAGQGTKTSVPAPPAPMLAKLDTIAGNQKWAALIEESESALVQARFAFTLHRHTYRALGGLGHAAAKAALAGELASLLQRMPTVLERQFADGSPFCDGATRAWIEEEVLPKAPSSGPRPAGEGADVLAEARKLLAGGQIDEAVALLSERVRSSSGATRFRARLALASTLADGGKLPVAQALFEALDTEVLARGLEEWDPALAAEHLSGFYSCLRAIANTKGAKTLPNEALLVYGRLCRADPTAALRVG